MFTSCNSNERFSKVFNASIKIDILHLEIIQIML